jgi:ribosome-binding protein aMBF1 (putative translation factor)
MQDEFPVVSRAAGKRLPPRPVQEIACSRCPATDAISAHDGRLPPHTAALKFAQRGWSVRGVGKHLCPACTLADSRKARPPKEPPMKEETKAKPAPKVAAANENQAPSAPASSAIVDLYMRLDDAYDRAARRYREGWSDERLAKETGLALAVVRERRERDFGPLVVDTTREDLAQTLGVLEAELGRAKAAVKEATRDVVEAVERLDDAGKALADARRLAARLLAPAGDKAA